MNPYQNLSTAIREMILVVLADGELIHTEKWQGLGIKQRPEAAMKEYLNFMFQAEMPSEELDYYRQQLDPTLPWADDHFLERVSGQPLNPPPSASWWPYAHKDNADYKVDGKVFTHSYPERLWPKRANGATEDRVGIRYPYGDLRDVINLLHREPLTRQAFINIWNHEDTGAMHGDRLPCTIGWHFIQRQGYLHVAYWIRSIDVLRHARNDLYMTVRLVLWVLDELRKLDRQWRLVKPGVLSFHGVSVHCFVGDQLKLGKQIK